MKGKTKGIIQMTGLRTKEKKKKFFLEDYVDYSADRLLMIFNVFFFSLAFIDLSISVINR